MNCLHLYRKWKKLPHELRGIKPEDLLHRLGLEVHHHPMHYFPAALGFFALGAAIGVGVALCLAPKSGKELREELSNRLHHGGVGSEENEE